MASTALLTFNEARVTFWISTNPNRNITQFGKNQRLFRPRMLNCSTGR